MAETARPVRLTVPGNDEGWARILADGVQVGHVRRGYRAWEAQLWAHAGDHAGGNADVPVVRGRLGDVRVVLRERVASTGPWWAAGHPDGRERAGSEMAATKED